MSLIEDAVRKHGKDFNCCFVFPSGLATRFWFRKALDITGLQTLPAELYISWDVFKESNLNFTSEKILKPVTPVIRKLYAAYFVNKNKTGKEKNTSILKYIIPEDFAETGEIFSEWVANILPQLDHWEKYFIKKCGVKDSEAEDLFLIKNDYSNFLSENNLFEPSWSAVSFNPHGKKYIIIFPELLEDFPEYAGLFTNRNDIIFLNLDENLKNSFSVLEFNDTRFEIKHIASQIEKLLLSGIEANEIAVSVANLQELKPYLKREFEQRGIPVEFHYGEPLSKNQASSLFKDINNTVETHYSFASLKTILLNKHISWKVKDIIPHFINFGIENNCAVSWQEKEVWKNVWDEGFNSVTSLTENEYKAKEMFTLFSSMIESIANAETFAAIQKNYFEFCDVFINANEFCENDENIISRCITILNELSILENEMPQYMPKKRFKFFLKLLDKEIYVEQSTGLNVSVFPYKIAAAIPIKYHFVMNMNQKDGTVIFNKLSFLRKDKKNSLGVFDSEASLYFAAAYNQSYFTQFSYSRKLYNNYAMAHSLFTNLIIAGTDEEDSFKQEKLLFENKQKTIKAIYKKQYDGFFKYLEMNTENYFSLHESAFGNCCDILKKQLEKIQYSNGNVTVSATDLNKFFSSCSVYWLMEKILKISFENFDAEIFNPRRTGNMYHFILENIYKKIKTEDKKFIKENISIYKEWAVEEIKNTTGKNIELRGPLAKPFIESMSSQIIDAVEFVFSFDSEKLNNYIQLSIEDKLDFLEDGILYNGKIDRMVCNDINLVILDYKKNYAPAFSDYNVENGRINDFQIPMYVFLSEKNLLAESPQESKVAAAFFLKLIDKDFVPVIISQNIDAGGKRSGVCREEFEDRIEVLKKSAKLFKEKINACNFVPEAKGWDICSNCRFKKICRTTFTVRGK